MRSGLTRLKVAENMVASDRTCLTISSGLGALRGRLSIRLSSSPSAFTLSRDRVRCAMSLSSGSVELAARGGKPEEADALAGVDDLVEQISDVGLRERLAAAVGDLRRRHRFGLVFEEHIPETTLLAGVPVSVGQVVQYRRDAKNLLWRVVSIKGSVAEIEPTETRKQTATRAVPISDLLTIKRFGDPVYPSLLPLGEARRSNTKPTHVVIDGENYHALQLLLYLHEGEVDCIYIDPPYNTGARDWKYNNRFVDAKDEWRHSKWLSMMDRRLRLAKRLLRPDGVLIVTIDEHEVHHLGMLLESIFPSYLRHMITIIINPKGTGKLNFGRVDEYALFCVPNLGRSIILGTAKAKVGSDLLDAAEGEEPEDEDDDDSDVDNGDDEEDDDAVEDPLAEAWPHPFPREEMDMWELRHARRRGSESGYRHQRPNQFYPIFIDPKTRTVVSIGDSLPVDAEALAKPRRGLVAVWPIDREGHHRVWRYIQNRCESSLSRSAWSSGNTTRRTAPGR